MKTGLVLEGGAMRGMFTAGVLDVFMENGITFPGAIGVSAGAVFGCNLKSNQPGRVIRYNTKYSRDPRYVSLRSLITTGDLYGEQFCYHELPDKLDPFDYDTFSRSPMAFYVVATDVHTGKPVYHKCGTDGHKELQWLRASASMPVVSRVVHVDGHFLLDGGMADSVPLRYFESIGYQRNVVVLTQPKEYRKAKSHLAPLMKLALRKYPHLANVMARRHEEYNKTMEYIRSREETGDVFVIRPKESLGISRTERDPEKLRAVYALGRKAAEEQLEAVRTFLQKE